MATLTEFSFPFDAVSVGGNYDRKYNADDFARYFRAFISSGIFTEASTNLQVIANGDMTVSLKSGKAIINGYRYELTEDATITIEHADGTLNRIDRIAITWDKANREILYTVRQGEGSANPIAPECRRTNDIIDFVVADIYVGAGVISITQANITDTRLDTEICGVATPFYPVDTTTIFNQFEAWFNEYAENGVAEIEELIAELKALVDADATARLQLEIDNLQDDVDEINDTLSNLITTTIASGDTSATITNSKIKTTSIVDVYFKDKVLAPTSLVVTDGQIVLEIDAEETDTVIGIRII